MSIKWRSLLDVLWPSYGRWNDAPSIQEEAATKQDMEAILGASWVKYPEVALAKAEEIVENEEERRRTAEGKASTCLLVVGALVPLLTYLESVILQDDDTVHSRAISAVLLLLGAMYLVASGLWALRTIGVRNYAVVGVKDLVRIWAGNKDVREQLIMEILVTARCNQEEINRKISAYKMAGGFLFRAVFAFGLLLAIRVSFGLYADLK